MKISEFFKELEEGKEPKVRYNVIVNGEWIASYDNEEKAWDVAIGYQNDDSGYTVVCVNDLIKDNIKEETNVTIIINVEHK